MTYGLEGSPNSPVLEITDFTNLGHSQPKTVTKLVPYRIKKIESQNKEEESRRLTRDERAAKNLNIPFFVQYIINCSMEEFTGILNNKSLDNEQINLCREIRRRGKNKVNTKEKNNEILNYSCFRLLHRIVGKERLSKLVIWR
jgi:hypothetical protein